MSSIKYDPPKSGLFDKIESESEARKTIKLTSTIVLIVAGIGLVPGLVSGKAASMLLPVFLGFLGFGLRVTGNRLFSIILCVFCALAVCLLAVAVIQMPFAIVIVVLAAIHLILLWLSIRCIQAGALLKRLERDKTSAPN